MLFKDILHSYFARGTLIRNEDLYNHYGNIPVYSAQTTGPIGYYNKTNYTTTQNTFIFSLNGANAGYISITDSNIPIWFSSDTGVLELKDIYIKQYSKEILSIWLQDFFIKNRHNNGTQPKFSILKILNKKIDISYLEYLSKLDLTELNYEHILASVLKNIEDINITRGTNNILLKDFISNYKERGKRLVKGRDLYINHGNIKVMSATTSGATGYYNSFNEHLSNNQFIYSIDGYNAGYISILPEQDFFMTDHAGIIEVEQATVEKYGRVAISLWLQDHFCKNRTSNGSQPTFMLKNVLDTTLDLDKLEILSNYNLDEYIK